MVTDGEVFASPADDYRPQCSVVDERTEVLGKCIARLWAHRISPLRVVEGQHRDRPIIHPLQVNSRRFGSASGRDTNSVVELIGIFPSVA